MLRISPYLLPEKLHVFSHFFTSAKCLVGVILVYALLLSHCCCLFTFEVAVAYIEGYVKLM